MSDHLREELQQKNEVTLKTVNGNKWFHGVWFSHFRNVAFTSPLTCIL